MDKRDAPSDGVVDATGQGDIRNVVARGVVGGGGALAGARPHDALRYRIAPLEMTPSEFRKVGRQLVERIAEFLCTLPNRPVIPNESPRVIREALGTGPLPEEGSEAKDLLEEAANLLFAHSTFNGHPRFWGVITDAITNVV